MPMDPPEQPSAQELPDPWGELSAPAVSKMQSGIRILDPWQFDFVSQDQNRSGYIYVVQDIESKLYKIGRTQNMGRRMQQLGVGKTARLVSSKHVPNAAEAERLAHVRYKDYRLPQTEYFRLQHPPSI
jgi:hypothetical protein